METLIGAYIAPAIQTKCRLIKLGKKTKAAIEKEWEGKNNYSPEDSEIINHVSSGYNYGIIPRNGLVVIDCDTTKLYDNIPEAWKESLTIITGRDGGAGYHIFLYCPDSPNDKVVIKDPETEAPLGDIRGANSRFYTVGAGSIHPVSGRKYEYVNPSAALVEVPWSDIKKHLIDAFMVHIKKTIPKTAIRSKGSLADKLGLRIEDFALPLNPTHRSNGDIQGAHPMHGSSTGMNFAINTQKGVWHCYRDNVGGDAIAWIAYANCGVDESRCNNLSTDEFIAVKDWLRNNGYSKQLDALDDEYHSDPELDKVDISGIINGEDPEGDDNYDEEINRARSRCLLPPFPEMDPGIFKDYIDLGKRVSYSLEEYHFAALLSVASMAIGRKVVAKVGMVDIHPNVFVMVVGQTTISGKSVACNMAINSFQDAVVYEEPIAKCHSTTLLTGTISEAALIQGLHDTYNSLWYWDDCAGFFEDAITWNAHVLGTMCSLYDGSKVERTLSKRSKSGEQFKWSCPHPFVSLLFNTTTKDIEQVASARLFSSGFFPRLMWFYGQGGQPRKNEDVSEDDKRITAVIKSQISKLRDTLRNYPMDGITFGVCDIIEDWKISATANRLNKEDEAFRTAVSRGFIHAYKIATILAMLDPLVQSDVLSGTQCKTRLRIPERHARMAIKIVEQYLIPRTMYVYEMCSSVDAQNHQVMVLKALNHFGGAATRKQVLRQTRLGKKDMDAALSTLHDSGDVQILNNMCDGGVGRPTTTIIKL